MVHELWIPFEDAARQVDKHPCNQMRQLREWTRVATWLRTESQRRDAASEDLSHHAV